MTKDPFIIYSSNLFAILSLRWVALRTAWHYMKFYRNIWDHHIVSAISVQVLMMMMMLLHPGRYIRLLPASCPSCAFSIRQWRSSWASSVGIVCSVALTVAQCRLQCIAVKHLTCNVCCTSAGAQR